MSDDEGDVCIGMGVIVCTEDDLMPYVLPRDPRAKHDPTPDEHGPLKTMLFAFEELKRLGWRDARYAPRDGTTFLAIEAGSTGTFECSRDSDGHYWIYDGDVWPARPIIWKPLMPPTPPRATEDEK